MTGSKAQENAEELALAALTLIVSDPHIAERFMDLAGIAPNQIRQAASEPQFCEGVLAFVMQSDDLVVRLAEQEGLKPESIARAYHQLAVGAGE